jgi:hypothetical protein
MTFRICRLLCGVCGLLLAASAWVPTVLGARQGLDTLPPIGPTPPSALPLFERITVEFSPPKGSLLSDATEITDMVRSTPTGGSFRFELILVRNDGRLRVWGRGTIGSSGGGVGGRMRVLNSGANDFFARGFRFDAVLLMQYSDNATGFTLRTRETPRCMFYNCFGDQDDEIVWERVQYRRPIPLDWVRQ